MYGQSAYGVRPPAIYHSLPISMRRVPIYCELMSINILLYNFLHMKVKLISKIALKKHIQYYLYSRNMISAM